MESEETLRMAKEVEPLINKFRRAAGGVDVSPELFGIAVDVIEEMAERILEAGRLMAGYQAREEAMLQFHIETLEVLERLAEKGIGSGEEWKT